MTILLTMSGDKKRLHLGCRKKLVVLNWAKSNIDGAMLKIFLVSNVRYYRQAATTIPVSDIGLSDCFAWKRV